MNYPTLCDYVEVGNKEAIETYVENNPTFRKQLCKFFEKDNRIAYHFASLFREYKDFIAHFIHEEDVAVDWSILFPEHKDYMRLCITTSYGAYMWATMHKHESDKVIDFVESHTAIDWAKHIGDKKRMAKIAATDSIMSIKWLRDMDCYHDIIREHNSNFDL